MEVAPNTGLIVLDFKSMFTLSFDLDSSRAEDNTLLCIMLLVNGELGAG